jgi:hypothetical protein
MLEPQQNQPRALLNGINTTRDAPPYRAQRKGCIAESNLAISSDGCDIIDPESVATPELLRDSLARFSQLITLRATELKV